uniref:Photosynthesis system II assembly factor Ycf48/Hcf136-like domain-containing protein n=1 Tax=viral metagenome TaxID=1070528 RepID=A0A6C0KH58_9ZZZZ
MFNNTKSNLSENKKFSRIMRDPRRNFTYLNVDNDDDVVVVPPFPPKPIPPYVPSWSWTQVEIPDTNDYVAVASDNSGQHLLVAAVGERIRYSDNSGSTWFTDTTPGINKNWTNIHSNSDGNILFACTSQKGIYKSTDGVNWSITNAPKNNFVWNDVVCNENGSLIIACIQIEGKIYNSIDDGFTWTPYTTPDASFNWRGLASNDTGNNLVGCASNDFIYKSTNDGVDWVKKDRYAEVQYSGVNLDFQHITGAIATFDPKDWIDITSNSVGTKLAACVAGGYIYTSISGETWYEHRNLGPKDWRSITSNSAGDKLAACVNEGYIYTSIDSGYSWTQQTIPGNEAWISIASNGAGDRLIICSADPDSSVWIGVFS